MQIPSLCVTKNATDSDKSQDDSTEADANQPISFAQQSNEECVPIPPQLIKPAMFANLTTNASEAIDANQTNSQEDFPDPDTEVSEE